MPTINELSGAAALSICESLLLAMNDGKLLSEPEIIAILKDAAASHEEAADAEDDDGTHRGVARLINGIIAGGNSVRRP
ncbi:hypothetical protein [Salinarimonas ramus]|uniref:Uncharacterized protein n=1 Tax=Salinarimonas ramus TaxID=690164 RepID=A0A917V597_9HYPH|nr:hypothetical protein [Salinarimonas ramus]GGK38551.1 hypothetical protein GCM10011322_26990 [Salinarimonas ramus]